MAVIFQQIMDMLLASLDFKMAYFLIRSETLEEHYTLLESLQENARV